MSRAIGRLVEHKPAVCTTYGALAAAVGIGSAKGVASSLSTNPGVSACEGARVLLLRWASPAEVRNVNGQVIQRIRRDPEYFKGIVCMIVPILDSI